MTYYNILYFLPSFFQFLLKLIFFELFRLLYQMQFTDYTNNSTIFKWDGSLMDAIQNRKFAGKKIHSGVIIDISGSMGEFISNLNKLQVVIDSLNLYLDFAKVLIDSGIEMKITIVTFSTRTELFYKSDTPMTNQDIDQLSKKLKTLTPTSSTVMAPAITELLKYESSDFKNTFIIMTDGYADDADYLLRNDKYKGKMQGAIGIGSAANYQESLLNYLSSKETTYGGFNAEELKKGIIGFLLTDLMCMAREIEIRFPPGIDISSPEVVTKDSDGFSTIKIERLLLDEIKAFCYGGDCEYEVSYRDPACGFIPPLEGDRSNGGLVVYQRKSVNVIDDKGSTENYCKFYMKYRSMIETPKKLKELHQEMVKIDFDVSSPLYPDWLDLVKQTKVLSEIKNTEDLQMASQQSAITRTFSTQVRSVGQCTPHKVGSVPQ